MSVRDDTPEEGRRGAALRAARPRRTRRAAAPDPEREPLGYYYDDGTNYETYAPARKRSGRGRTAKPASIPEERAGQRG